MQRKTVKMMVSGMAQWYAVARQKRTAEATVRVENLYIAEARLLQHILQQLWRIDVHAFHHVCPCGVAVCHSYGLPLGVTVGNLLHQRYRKRRGRRQQVS